MAAIENQIVVYQPDETDLNEKVGFFVQTQTPPPQDVFYDGQFWNWRHFHFGNIKQGPWLQVLRLYQDRRKRDWKNQEIGVSVDYERNLNND